MSLGVYFTCGVPRPMSDPGDLMDLGARYQRLSSVASHCHTVNASVISYVQAMNEGPTVDAYSARMSGQGSAAHQLSEITTKSAETSAGYFAAAHTLSSTRLSMDIATVRAATMLKMIDLNPLDPNRAVKRKAVIDATRVMLKRLESRGAVAIHAALAVTAPPLIDVGAQRPNESITPEVAKKWEGLGRDHKMRILKKLVEEYAKAHGIDPPPPIKEFYPKPGTKEAGWAGYWDGTSVNINGNNLDSPIAMNIIIHEMQHAVQSEIRRKYDNLSPQDRQDMRDGKIPDIFTVNGSSIEEAERFNRAEPHYENSGPRYPRAPKEIDAGRGVYEWSDNLTEKELQRLIDATR